MPDALYVLHWQRKRVDVVEGSGNVYADLGFRDAAAIKVKAGLRMKIEANLKQRRLTQMRSAEQWSPRRPSRVARTLAARRPS